MSFPNLGGFPGASVRRSRGGYGGRFGGAFGGRRPWWWSLVALLIAGVSYYTKQHHAAPPPSAASSSPPASVSPSSSADQSYADSIQSEPGKSNKPNKPLASPTAATRPRSSGGSTSNSPTGSPPASAPSGANQALLALIRAHETNPTVVTASGTVVKVLPDDNDGDRHQRLLVNVSSADTILIAHNIDVARRIEVAEGDAIKFKGEYIWNDRGGVVHWTHHDPRKKHPAGWVEVKGKRFD